jgi:predicted AlkP superfamily phosphohydrolase/phosphomutase
VRDRLLVVGWDGADWDILRPLMDRGDLPTLSAMVAEGATADLLSTIPYQSWSAWSTFLTGVGPAGHGVYDFVERDPTRPESRVPVSSRSIRVRTFLKILSDAGHEVRAGNIPVTFPPIPLRGRIISGVAIPPGAEYVRPADWAEELDRTAPFPVNGMEWMRFGDRPERLVAEARSFVERRTNSFLALLEGQWSAAVCVYVAPDRLQHPFGAFLLPSHPKYASASSSPLGEQIRAVYRVLDEDLARLRDAAGPTTTTVLISDHGFRPITRMASLQQTLADLGFTVPARMAGNLWSLRRSRWVRSIANHPAARAIRRRVTPAAIEWSRSVAYDSATGWGVSVNLIGREPKGIVEPRDMDRVVEDIRLALLSYGDPSTGLPVAARVHRREDLFDGPYSSLSPDLVVEPTDMLAFGPGTSAFWDTEWPTGTHRRRGVLVAAGGRAAPSDLGERHLADVTATALAFFGLHPPGEGRAIEEISGVEGGSHTPEDAPGTGAPTSEWGDTAGPATEHEEQHVAQHLRDLGYIE